MMNMELDNKCYKGSYINHVPKKSSILRLNTPPTSATTQSYPHCG